MSLINFFLIFFLWRIFNFFIIFITPKFIPYLGFFPYKEEILKYNLPVFLNKLANFDGIHYLLISERGYGQYEQAFFPLYPFLIKVFSFFTHNSLLSGLIISNVFFFFGLIFLIKYFKLVLPNLNQTFFVLVLFLFPTSFYFGAVYTEGLFFFFFAGTLYFLKKEKYLMAGIFSFLASLTRLIGIFLIIFFIFDIFKKLKKSNHPSSLRFRPTNQFTNYFFTLFPLFGLILYSFYLYKTTGDPLMFFHSQPAFGANRSTSLIFLPQVIWRYIKIFFTAKFNFQYFISLVEFIIFFFVFFILILDIKNFIEYKNSKIKIKNFDLLGLNIFSFSSLVLPTLTGTFSSIPRYSLFSISLFIYIAKIKNNFLKFFILTIFLIFHILFLAFFSQGYFIS